MFRLLLAAVVLAALPGAARAQEADCSLVRPTMDRITVADHSLVEVGFQGLVDQDGDPATYEVLDVFQDEPVGGTSADDVCPDVPSVGDETVMLRAERDPAGDGRVYHVHFSADLFGFDTCEGIVTVCVPNDGKCGDGGALVDSTNGQCPADCTPDRCDAVCQEGCVTPPPDPCSPPADALVDLRCTLNQARLDSTCSGDRPPQKLGSLLDRIASWAEEARTATGPQAAKLLKRIERTVRRTRRLVVRYKAAKRLSADCADTLESALQTARDDAASVPKS